MTAPKAERGVPLDMLNAILFRATPAEAILHRPKPGGGKLDYITARYVEGVLDELGPENWQRQHVIGDGGKVACGIGILVRHPDGTPEWVWKWDGAGETDIEGEKGSFSDAFKRAGACWGIARDLYPEVKAVAAADPEVVRREAERVFADDIAPDPRQAAPQARSAPQDSPDDHWPLKLAGSECEKHPGKTWAKGKNRETGEYDGSVWHGLDAAESYTGSDGKTHTTKYHTLRPRRAS